MRNNRFISLMILVAGLQSGAIAQQQPPRKMPEEQRHFLRAKRLIEDNCVDCMGSTKAGMEQGIQEMQAALAAGLSNKKAAYKLLADAYNAMSTFSGNDAKERAAFEEKETEALGVVYRLDPQDSEFAVRYAGTLKDKQEELAIYKAVADKDPLQTDAAFGAGMLLIEDNEASEGIPYISKAIANQKDPEAVENYARRAMGALQEQNCPFRGAEEWNQKFLEAFEKATRGEGDPTAMPKVKTEFLQQLEKHTCKTNK